MTRYVAPIATIADRERTMRSGRILRSIKDQETGDGIGRYAGWGSGEDAAAPEAKDREGPQLAPFLRYRRGDRAWRLSLGCLWVPAIIVLLTVEDWMHIPQGAQWVSLGVLLVAFLAATFISDRVMR